MSDLDSIPVIVLLGLLGLALGGGGALIALVVHWRRTEIRPIRAFGEFNADSIPGILPIRTAFLHRPTTWLAVRSRNLQVVQAALGLNNPQPCTWVEGLASEQKLFIAPPVNGWILAIGSGLPEPGEDVDATFRFLLELSRKIGEVQFFNANRALGHHAWVWAEAGRIVRAYAWAGRTVWNQGAKTRPELDLGLKCFPYLEAPEYAPFGVPDLIAANTEKVSLLAARWSLDPVTIDERVFEHAHGIAGEPPRLY